MDKNLSKNLHVRRLQEIREFVGFDYDGRKKLSPYQKRKIKRYHDALQVALAKPGETLLARPRKKENMEKAKAVAGIDKSLTQIKAVPIQVTTKTKIKYTKSGVKLKGEHVTKTFFPADVVEVMTDPEKFARQTLKKFPRAKSFSMSANGYENRGTISRNMLASSLGKEMGKYQSSFSDWFTGIWVYEFKSQADLSEYRNERNAARERKKRDRRNKKRRENRARK